MRRHNWSTHDGGGERVNHSAVRGVSTHDGVGERVNQSAIRGVSTRDGGGERVNQSAIRGVSTCDGGGERVNQSAVETQQRVKAGDSVTLTCKSSCSLTEQTTFIWYRNTLRFTEGIVKENQLHLQSVSHHDAGDYRCAVTGHEHLISPAVHLNVDWVYGLWDQGVNYSPSYVCALKGSTVKISCTLTNPQYDKLIKGFWTKPVGESPDVCSDPEKRGRVQCHSEYEHIHSITLMNVTEADNHVYYCRFTGYWSNRWTGIPGAWLDVADPPKSVSVSISPSGEIMSGDSVTLNCSSDLNPPAEISWFKGETLVRSGRIFSISNISSDHSGEYKCRSRNKHGEKDSDTVMLNVMYPPKSVSVSISPSGEIVSGDSVTLNCSSDSNPPALNFSWFKEDETSAVGSGQSFSISSFNSSFSGRFYCLQVETQQRVKEGDSVTLTCKSSCSLTEQTTFIWYRNTQRFTEGIVKENQLHLQSVSHSDEGNYRCAVRGHDHLISPAVHLDVEYPPKSVSVSISPSGEIVSGDSVTLNCSSDSNPPAEISWFKGETLVRSGRIFSISNISSDHSGEYKCRSRNKLGEKDSDTVMLNVMYPPKSVSVSISPSGEIVSGDSVTLNCSSDSNPPALNFSWFKENETSAVGSGQSFSISSFSSSFSGRFYCEAQNKYGSQRSASVSLTVKGGRRGEKAADASDDTYTALDPASRTSADIYSTITSVQSRAPDDTYTALELQSRSSEYETLAVTSADPH
ncbi:B-cell receptor CD22 [Anabarilius grahami]|uniref:B-cell receptor CD22 n=1 Tax=Anabarilius grahami TaxID=495550 RepID=A0A3N0XRL2_ANAGA|nr:B-cell receptor CD22 [Anabarilius grahami]